ncbi:MAG: RES family NAD+ phosphorylase [Okeania sp. SIO3I5]|uniref:RES family NAD+ phosphorylase n=1 Tax=Okeania sp. SIO3I5 TaxID=2607805 RepID=UPI0013BBDDE0|nr:RES family NAD+ phosphorylase [Okeania sp. SIO3I5]NEQ35523.1 RES family NAD+ phosphorylase [Okeania sp. SIO3I5]
MSLTLWRISHKKYINTALIGEGYNRGRGRWNSKGTALIYTSATLSLAALETLVCMEIENFGNIFVSISIKIPDNFPIKQVDESLLPHNWRDTPPPEALASIGDRWFASKTTALLRVPSAIIPQEYNYLINPLHPDFEKISIAPPQPFILDRNFKSIDKNLLTKL